MVGTIILQKHEQRELSSSQRLHPSVYIIYIITLEFRKGVLIGHVKKKYTREAELSFVPLGERDGVESKNATRVG